MDLRYLVIEGNIGVGKTSLCRKIAAEKNAKLILEQFAENPFLPKFYENPERFSFPLELSFLADRYNQLKRELSSFDLFQELIIADYFFMKSLIFSSQTLDEDEYKLYRQLFNIIYDQLPKPDLYVYLHRPVEQLIRNIKRRGRAYEQNIKEEYLKKIEAGYYNFFKQQNNFKIILVNIENLDFINNENDYKKITDAIFNKTYKDKMTIISL
ncbi:MAG: deoxynucleoside kinase [Bacteroidales bacterium]|nr:deoxynucleoside kinase [Bacteroidales bacterium]